MCTFFVIIFLSDRMYGIFLLTFYGFCVNFGFKKKKRITINSLECILGWGEMRNRNLFGEVSDLSLE